MKSNSHPSLRVEYPGVRRVAGREGWLDELMAAHATPCTVEEAQEILAHLDLPADIKLNWRPGTFRGRARFSRLRRQFGISLPTKVGGRAEMLRAGLVLHEAAHVWDRQATGKFGHGQKFCNELREAITTTGWRRFMPTSSFATIYNRHRGPYSISLIREIDHGGKRGREQTSDRLPGPFTAEEAHEEARMLVGDPRENVKSAFVFSETEGQFTGANYNRGETYRPWAEENAAALDDAPPVEQIELSPADQVEFVKAVVEPAPPTEALKQAAAKVKEPKAPKAPRKAGLALQIAEGSEARWPKAASAQAVFEAFQAHGKLTPKQAAEILAPKLAELNVAHPASAISRLKQAGLLIEVASE